MKTPVPPLPCIPPLPPELELAVLTVITPESIELTVTAGVAESVTNTLA